MTAGLPTAGSEPAARTQRAAFPGRSRLSPPEAGRCRRRVHLDHDVGRDRAERAQPDSSAALRIADLERHRAALLGLFPQAVAGWSIEDSRRPAVLVSPRLRSDTRIGVPELLLWDGDGYLPVLIRGHRTLDSGAGALVSDPADPLTRTVSATVKMRPHPEDALVLAHFHRLLEELGLASLSAIGGVLGSGNTFGGQHLDRIVWHRLDVWDNNRGGDAGGSVLSDYDLRFADRHRVALAAATGEPALAGPSQVGECRRCPWAALCLEEMTAARDVSLVAPGADGFLLKEAGLDTIDDLANADPQLLAALPLTGVAAEQGRLRARAWQRRAPLVRRVERPQVRRADVELDVDMESFLEDGAYLWGTYLSGTAAGADLVQQAGHLLGYRAFVTWQELPSADEGRAFAEFWAYLTELRRVAAAAGLSFAAYCYSRQAEERWLKSTPVRYPQVPGMPTPAEIKAFISTADWVDLFEVIGQEFLVPGSRRLKSVATVAGFHWRDPEPGGANSMVWYRGAVDNPPDLDLRRRVLEYNEDDVIATKELRIWIDQRSDEVPTAAELEAAPPVRPSV